MIFIFCMCSIERHITILNKFQWNLRGSPGDMEWPTFKSSLVRIILHSRSDHRSGSGRVSVNIPIELHVKNNNRMTSTRLSSERYYSHWLIRKTQSSHIHPVVHVRASVAEWDKVEVVCMYGDVIVCCSTVMKLLSDGLWWASGGEWCTSDGLWCASGGEWCTSGGECSHITVHIHTPPHIQITVTHTSLTITQISDIAFRKHHLLAPRSFSLKVLVISSLLHTHIQTTVWHGGIQILRRSSCLLAITWYLLSRDVKRRGDIRTVIFRFTVYFR